MTPNPEYMRRALRLAATSQFDTHPNPCVGAVIVCDGKIIGEGYHRRCGEGHAEVNAIASVKDKSLLSRSTMYVTLEPCSHYGKTPPCAKLIIDSMIPRVVVGAVDPFEKVAGRGIAMLREAGVEVVSGVLADESRALNERFITAHTERRPFITLKWAQSSDGFMDCKRNPGTPAPRFSTDATTMLVHRQRALHDAILTSAATVVADNPSLTTRDWSGPNPIKVIIDRRGLLTPDSYPLLRENAIIYSAATCSDLSLHAILSDLYSRGITSILVEAGPTLLQSFIDEGLWDVIRTESAPFALASDGKAQSPSLPRDARLRCKTAIGENIIRTYSHDMAENVS